MLCIMNNLFLVEYEHKNNSIVFHLKPSKFYENEYGTDLIDNLVNDFGTNSFVSIETTLFVSNEMSIHKINNMLHKYFIKHTDEIDEYSLEIDNFKNCDKILLKSIITHYHVMCLNTNIVEVYVCPEMINNKYKDGIVEYYQSLAFSFIDGTEVMRSSFKMLFKKLNNVDFVPFEVK